MQLINKVSIFVFAVSATLLVKHVAFTKPTEERVVDSNDFLNNITFSESGSNDIIPDAVDWRNYSTVVREERPCRSSYAFSVVAMLETYHTRKTQGNPREQLAPQYIIDCKRQISKGCSGGSREKALELIVKNEGLCLEEQYSYQSRKQDACFPCKSVTKPFNKGSIKIMMDADEMNLKKIVSKYPVTAEIEPTDAFMNAHGKEIFRDTTCNPLIGGHSVTIVGYGTEDDGNDYWLIKNSWGENWGDSGYLRYARNANNMCGIAYRVIYIDY